MTLHPTRNPFLIHTALWLAIALAPTLLFAQNSTTKTAKITGIVTEVDTNLPLQFANVYVQQTEKGTSTNAKGEFQILVPANTDVVLRCSYINYETQNIRIFVNENETKNINIALKIKSIKEVVIQGRESDSRTGIQRIDPKISTALANPSGNFEMILQSFGAKNNNELSSQYSVRGGNFDENLVYVNDVEIYRPLLTRSGQQEGLSFINPNMVGSIVFSAGAFQAKYGDKLSSVLDVQYRKPTGFAAGINGSLLGGGFNFEGTNKSKTLTYIFAARYRTLSNLLGTLDTKGIYAPSASDIQSYISYQKNEKWEFGLMANYSTNKFDFVPETQSTSFGTVSTSLKLDVYYEGKEVTEYQTLTLASTAKYQLNKRTQLKFIASNYNANEQENFDIEGSYQIGITDNDLSSSNFGEIKFVIGDGTFHRYGRNRLKANITNIEHKGSNENQYGLTQWGVKLQHDQIDDKLYEWSRVDSVDYSLPIQSFSDSIITLNEFYNAQNTVNSNRIMGFVQHTWNFNWLKQLEVSAGMRYNYWSFNQQLVLSPRIQFSLKPIDQKNWILRGAAGIYAQPVFYREMRNYDGSLNANIKAQHSLQALIGSDYTFKIWNRPFRFVAEAYYKQFTSIIPYDIDNVRLRYRSNQQAVGYATGLDLRINGEFVGTLESWATISLLKTREDILGDTYTDTDGKKQEIGYTPRPTDQRVNFSIMFQDYLPKNPSYKVNMNLVYGTRLPFGPPYLQEFSNLQRFRNGLRMQPYRRVDIGFSKQLIGQGERFKTSSFVKNFKTLWLSVEVFNLLQIRNTVSFTWLRDTGGNMFPIPNYLTNRQLNIRLVGTL